MHPKHPATYTNSFIPLFAEILKDSKTVLDPMGGTGKLARIKDYGYTGQVVCNELEPEWANGYAVDHWHFGDAANMAWAEDESFDAICLSPVYGNRMSDTYVDGSRRITYTAYLGRNLNPQNTGRLQWGKLYRYKHLLIYIECLRVLKPNGLFVLNVSDHIRDGKRIYVSKWHLDVLRNLGLKLVKCHVIKTPRARYGKNHNARCAAEFVFVMQKEASNEYAES
jgi:SAM-dependent methyltransferase